MRSLQFTVNSRQRSQKGFSIIEVVLVIMIVGFIALLITNLPSSINLVGESQDSSIAKEIAAKNIEILRERGFENLAEGTTPITDSRLAKLNYGSGNVIIEACPNTICSAQEALSVKQVRIRVSFIERNETKTVELATLIAQGGIR